MRLKVCTGARPVMRRKNPSGAFSGAVYFGTASNPRLASWSDQNSTFFEGVSNEISAPSSTVMGVLGPIRIPSFLSFA